MRTKTSPKQRVQHPRLTISHESEWIKRELAQIREISRELFKAESRRRRHRPGGASFPHRPEALGVEEQIPGARVVSVAARTRYVPDVTESEPGFPTAEGSLIARVDFLEAVPASQPAVQLTDRASFLRAAGEAGAEVVSQQDAGANSEELQVVVA